MFDREMREQLRKKLTGTPTGSAHGYRVNKPSRRTGSGSGGEWRRCWLEYVQEYIQEDGSSKFFITEETWEDWCPWNGCTLMGPKEILNVQEFATLRAAQAVWDDEPITQGVASEEMQKPLPRVVPCRWCKGNPMGALMLDAYVPCLECGPKVVETVHDEVVVDTEEWAKEGYWAKKHGWVEGRKLRVQEGVVFREETPGQAEDRIDRTGLRKLAKVTTFPMGPREGLTHRPGDEKARKFQISFMSDAHYGVPQDVNKIAAQVKAGTNPILNWLLNGKAETSRSSTKPEEVVRGGGGEMERIHELEMELKDELKHRRVQDFPKDLVEYYREVLPKLPSTWGRQKEFEDELKRRGSPVRDWPNYLQAYYHEVIHEEE